jgi:hypothetical protein
MVIENPQTPPDYDLTRIVERSDGFYWRRKESGKTSGPFATLAEAVEDMEYADGNLEDGEPLEEAENDIGIADWIDPDTGQPAEDSVPHIEDH